MIPCKTSASSLFIQRSLLDWYLLHARDLPWRRTKDPYAIWVSEIMLQQTQVQTVIAYYERWLQKFPTLRSLAAAERHDVLSAWAGLGYYRRARMLHEASQIIMTEYCGIIPPTVERLMKLPGIGRYTAGAISSIAFEQKAPVLDGNVMRVLSRICAIEEDITDKNTLKKLWSLAEALLPDEKPGDLNQALMELGATVCTPFNPACGICPVSESCEARNQGRQSNFPVKKEKEKQEKIETYALVLRSEASVFLRRQPEYGRWGGLWMFPFWHTKGGLLDSCGLTKNEIVPFTTIEHGFTKYRVTLRVFEARGQAEQIRLIAADECEDRWVKIDEVSDYALPAPHKKILKEMLQRHAAETPA